MKPSKKLTGLTTLLFAGVLCAVGYSITLAENVEQRVAVLATKLDRQIGHLAELESPAGLDNRRLEVRRFMIHSQLAQGDHPIVIMGDSITEAAWLPDSVCGRPIVNAGIGGMTAGSYLAQFQQITTNQPMDLAVIALGTNDASSISNAETGFAASYVALADFVAKDAPKTIFVGIPPIDANGALAKGYFNLDSASRINDTIHNLARDRKIGFVDLRTEMTGPNLTVDGVHLDRAGYQLWSAAMLSAIRSAIGCAATSAR